jgi:hypothetical protein
VPFLYKIGKNSAAALSGHSTFYSALVELCGKTIGQLATLAESRTSENNVQSHGRMNYKDSEPYMSAFL